MILKFRTIFTELILRETKAEINSKPAEPVTFALLCIVLCVDGRDVTKIDTCSSSFTPRSNRSLMASALLMPSVLTGT